MDKIFVVFVLAVALNQAWGMNLRHKRQLGDDENDFEDRYGDFGNRPSNSNSNLFPGQGQFQQGQGQFQQGQGQFPGLGQGQFQQGPGQFPGQGQGQFQQGQGQFSNQGQGQFPGQGQRTTSTTPASASTTTTLSPEVNQCIRNCPVTPEYNPVCGTNNVTYDNPGRLICAQNCGVTVTMSRTSRCPAATTSG